MEDGRVVTRQAGTPQGGVISPLLANLFLHYALDKWMAREFPHIPFERYADDVICHCRTEEDARALWRAIADRFAACKLVLHPEKTRIVYCKGTIWIAYSQMGITSLRLTKCPLPRKQTSFGEASAKTGIARHLQ